MENKKLIQQQLSELVQQDFIDILTGYSNSKVLNLELVVRLVQDINLFKRYDVVYIHNLEFDQIIDLMREELKDFNMARSIALLTCLDFLQNVNQDFKKLIYVNLSLKVPSEIFMEAFSFFNVLVPNVKELFNEFIIYIFNDRFLTLDENIQIETIYKIWNFSQQLYHDNDASKYAYDNLKPLFDKALIFEKTEVAFWLYYTPLHYFHSGTGSNIHELNEKFKNEIEKPLQKYILEKIIPKYKIKPNDKKTNKNEKIKVAFVMQRIIRHSTMNVFYSLVKDLMSLKNNKYEFIIYDMSFPEAGGSEEDFVKEFKNLGIKYMNLHQEIFGDKNPIYSLLTKCLRSREILINNNIDVLIGLHTRIEYIFFYTTRTTLKQVYWYHGSNAQYDIKGIDFRIGHCSFKNKEFEFKYFTIDIDKDKYNPKVDKKLINNVKNNFPKNKLILGSIGRLVKIDNIKYLETIVQILENNPKTIYLACGEGDVNSVKNKIKDKRILERFYFTGFIDSRIYGNIIDIYLTPFPEGGGEALYECVFKGKAFVFMGTNENYVYNNQFNFDIVYEENNVRYIRKELYSTEDLDNISNKGYLIEENNNCKFFSFIPFVYNIEEYIKVTNRLINDVKLREKIIYEFTNCNYEPNVYFLDLIGEMYR